jgi:hypothetical protein
MISARRDEDAIEIATPTVATTPLPSCDSFETLIFSSTARVHITVAKGSDEPEGIFIAAIVTTFRSFLKLLSPVHSNTLSQWTDYITWNSSSSWYHREQTNILD